MTTAEALATLSGFVEELDLGEERAALAHIEKRIEELERLNSELTLGQEYMEKWSDRGDFLCYRHEWLDLEARVEAAEARVKELEKERDDQEQPTGDASDRWSRLTARAEAAEAQGASMSTSEVLRRLDDDGRSTSEALPLQSKVGAKLDDSICRMLAVIDRYTEDSRGPSVGWTRELAGTVEILMRCRRLGL